MKNPADTPAHGTIAIEQDGFYHPGNEHDIVQLVRMAGETGREIRCRGAAHSVAWSIYTDPGAGEPPIPNKVSVDVPPNGPHINILFDRFRKFVWIDEARGIAEVEAGIHLGADPGKSALEDGLLYQAWEKNWALSDLGGITHQTVSGFLMTGSAGGSLAYDISENILAFRVIDGAGNAEWIARDNPVFDAFGTSMGLLGIVSKVRLQFVPAFIIKGREKATPTALDRCDIDLFGPGTGDKPGLEDYFGKAPYSRILWWPQMGVEEVIIWEADRHPVPPDFEPKPYIEFETNRLLTQLEQLAAALLFTLLGNANPLSIWHKASGDFKRFRLLVNRSWKSKLGSILASVGSLFVAFVCAALLAPVVFVLSLLPFLTRKLLNPTIRLIQPLTSDKSPPKHFEDYYWRSLPMDNATDDVLLGTEFTEIWLPVRNSERVMNLLKEHYAKGYSATGFFCCELYAGSASKFWLHPGYTNGNDEFADGTIRVDVFWYINNADAPNGRGQYYSQFWELFRSAGIPFRLHWGKFVPGYDYSEWSAYYREQLPHFGEFLKLRERRDPKNVFLTRYWRQRLYGE